MIQTYINYSFTGYFNSEFVMRNSEFLVSATHIKIWWNINNYCRGEQCSPVLFLLNFGAFGRPMVAPTKYMYINHRGIYYNIWTYSGELAVGPPDRQTIIYFLILLNYFLDFITLAGLPTATLYGGIGLTTTEPAPIIEPSPISPEYIMQTPIPT